MKDAQIKRVRSDQVEERSLTSDFLTGAATTAGGLTVIGAVAQGKQVVSKLKDKVAPKDKA
jgi:hypothetical protein